MQLSEDRPTFQFAQQQQPASGTAVSSMQAYGEARQVQQMNPPSGTSEYQRAAAQVKSGSSLQSTKLSAY